MAKEEETPKSKKEVNPNDYSDQTEYLEAKRKAEQK